MRFKIIKISKLGKKSIFELVKNNSSNITILSDIDNRNFKELKN